MQQNPELEDPYLVLGVEKTATQEAIKAAFRKQALKNHPDKNPSPEAAEAFKRSAAAFAILSDPVKRRKYDVGGYSQLQPADLEIDLSNAGLFTSALAALFFKLGVPLKTSVPPQLLEAAYEGRCPAQPLQFGVAVEGTMDKNAAAFYDLRLSRKQIDDGLIIAAHSKSGSRLKLLLFEQSPEGRWELAVQEDSTPAGSSAASRAWQVAGIYCLPFPVYSLGPRLGALETAKAPEASLFRRLDTLQKRETVMLRPGPVLVVVQGDNMCGLSQLCKVSGVARAGLFMLSMKFKRVQYTLQVLNPFSKGLGSSVEALQASEYELAQERHALAEFETSFTKAKAAYKQACEQFEAKQEALQALISRRELAHQALLVPGSVPADPGGPDAGHVS